MFESILVWIIILICIIAVLRKIVKKLKMLKTSNIESACDGDCPGCGSKEKEMK